MPETPTRPAHWQLLVYGDERTYRGNDGYKDEPSMAYAYDSFVGNHKQLATGDLVLLRGKERALGFARVVSVSARNGSKQRWRCPVSGCEETDIASRKTKAPEFRCHSGHEFDLPDSETVRCVLYRASFGETFVPSPYDFQAAELNAAVTRFATMQAIKRMQPEAFWQLAVKAGPAVINYFQRDVLDGESAEDDDLREAVRTMVGGQGRLASTARAAVERFSMQRAIEHYLERGWDVEDQHTTQPFDLLCRKDGMQLFIEVKGSTGPASSVWLTANEVRHAQEWPAASALFVVSEIELVWRGEQVTATGGKDRVFQPWSPAAVSLRPVVFRYELPLDTK